MPVLYTLRENGHIEHIIIADPWTLQDLVALFNKRKPFLAASPLAIHTFIDVRNVTTIPLGVVSFVCTEQVHQRGNQGYTAVFGCSRLLRGVSDTILQLAHYDRARFFDMEGDAWAFLCSKVETPAQTVLAGPRADDSATIRP